MRRRAAVLLALLPAIALAACGASDDDAVRDAITSALTQTDPDNCEPGRTQTAAFQRQSTFGVASLQNAFEQTCRKHVKRLAATSVSVSDVEVDGDRATAAFRAIGGAYSAERATVALTKRDDRWLLDRLTALELDRDAFEEQLALELELGATSRRDAECFARRLSKVPERAIETSIVESRPGVYADAYLVCFSRPELRKRGLTLSQTRCIIVRLRREGDALMRAAFSTAERDRRELGDRFARAGQACANR